MKQTFRKHPSSGTSWPSCLTSNPSLTCFSCKRFPLSPFLHCEEENLYCIGCVNRLELYGKVIKLESDKRKAAPSGPVQAKRFKSYGLSVPFCPAPSSLQLIRMPSSRYPSTSSRPGAGSTSKPCGASRANGRGLPVRMEGKVGMFLNHECDLVELDAPDLGSVVMYRGPRRPGETARKGGRLIVFQGACPEIVYTGGSSRGRSTDRGSCSRSGKNNMQDP